MRKRVEIEVDDDLVQEAIRRFHLADAREAVHLALNALLSEADDSDKQPEEEYDEFSDLSAWEPHRNRDAG
ncbi:MAG: type II toxin-antitoxin system VapB family antitoxin [Mycobacterium sp.]|uniref:type II toxin-antitoxin system VapB family antitoxin n=1 Tax=Mycobacterium sp. TaxID=1785 RepID=UPI001ED60518|nr:type II toxin-antitoxin system VapB family antitoxin [Mycobacterium sp.]MBW0020040.1 type II toxin-antitoxin system VapB family antitoxin [Mycobacterium sp.]